MSATVHLWDLPPGLSLYVFLLNEITFNSPVFFVGKKFFAHVAVLALKLSIWLLHELVLYYLVVRPWKHVNETV
jgi:hypothetical protein